MKLFVKQGVVEQKPDMEDMANMFGGKARHGRYFKYICVTLSALLIFLLCKNEPKLYFELDKKWTQLIISGQKLLRSSSQQQSKITTSLLNSSLFPCLKNPDDCRE